MSWISVLLRALGFAPRRRGRTAAPPVVATPEIAVPILEPERSDLEPAAPESPAPAFPQPEPTPVAHPEAPPAVADAALGPIDEVEEDEPEDDEAAEDEDAAEPDPFVSAERPQAETLSPEAVAERRAAALSEALAGPHRIFLSDEAGPGSLAEALKQLLDEGRVTVEFREEAEDGDAAHLLYRPVALHQ